MPRKQNGWGSTKSLAFKGNGRVDVGKVKGSPGSYPSNRRYGSSVHRTVIEKYDLDSDWIKWRKGYEYYNQAAWYKLQQLDEFSGEYKNSQIESVLYQGTPDQIDVVFDGYKFATTGADSNNHYVMKRTTVSETNLGVVDKVYNDSTIWAENKANKEIWAQIEGKGGSRMLLQMIGERLTDGTTEATLDFVLTQYRRPALFIGKSPPQYPATVTVRMNNRTLLQTVDNVQDLVGKVVYIPDFYTEIPLEDFDQLDIIEDDYRFALYAKESKGGVQVNILDPGENSLPPSLYDINSLPTLLETNTAEYTIQGTYVFEKDLYQRFYGNEYLVGETVLNECERGSFVVMPFKVLGVEDDGAFTTLTSVPFLSELKLYADIKNAILAFTDYSFTQMEIDEYDGEYYHQLGKPGDPLWMRLNTEVNPWDNLSIFNSGQDLRPATIYTCSCPNHSHSILRAPQSTEDEGTRKINRQRRYPLPTVLGQTDYNAIGKNQAAGAIESWESREHRMGFKMCKHSIAAMFIEKIKVKEPSSYPSMESRIKFESKLEADIAEVANEFRASYERGGITTLEIIFALAQGLNLDDVELAYVILNSNF